MRRSVLCRLVLATTSVLCLLAAPQAARAADYVPLPTLDGKAGGASGLKIRVVRYTGGVNGEMIVDVKNPGPRTAVFSAEGLYFVPDGTPEKAPQRLGAAGPFQVEPHGGASSASPQRAEKIDVPAGGEARVRLQVFCIDSHRSSPTAEHTFHVGKERLPKPLRAEISATARTTLEKYQGHMPAAKAAIQSGVWASRDKKWIKLDGERRLEKPAPVEQRLAPAYPYPQLRRRPLVEPQAQPVPQREAP